MARTKQTPASLSAKKAARKQGVVTDGKKPHRFRNGTVALRDIRHEQKSTKVLFRRAPFKRIVREVIATIMDDGRLGTGATDALMEAAQSFLVELLGDAYKLTLDAKRVELAPTDLRRALDIRKDPIGIACHSAMMRRDEALATRGEAVAEPKPVPRAKSKPRVEPTPVAVPEPDAEASDDAVDAADAAPDDASADGVASDDETAPDDAPDAADPPSAVQSE